MTVRLFRVGATIAIVACAASLGAPFTAGCGTQCERNPNEAPVPFDAGITSGAGTLAGWYQSAPWDGEYIDFPPGRTYRFKHDLGGCPAGVFVYGAFNPNPVAVTNDAGPHGGSALLAGNQATVERVTATTFDVRNDTCSRVFIRVQAANPDFSKHCRAAMAAGDGGPPSSTTDAAPP